MERSPRPRPTARKYLAGTSGYRLVSPHPHLLRKPCGNTLPQSPHLFFVAKTSFSTKNGGRMRKIHTARQKTARHSLTQLFKNKLLWVDKAKKVISGGVYLRQLYYNKKTGEGDSMSCRRTFPLVLRFSI